jgi:methyl-accepting chemotaxis protein
MTLQFANLDAQRRFGGRMIVLLAWLMVPVVIGARLAVQGPVWGVLIGAAAVAAGATAAWRIAGQGSMGRSLTGVALMAQVSLLVAAMGGSPWQIDMHMAYFAALAVLVIYSDALVIAAAAATVAVHHLGLSYLLPAAVFPDQASLGRVILHAVILIIEAATLIGVTISVNAMFAAAEQARHKAETAVSNAQTAHAEVEAARRAEAASHAKMSQVELEVERQRAEAVGILAQQLARLASGDLTARIEAEIGDNYAQIKRDFNAAVDALRGAISAIDTSSGAIRGGSDEIAQASADLSRSAAHQATSLGETASALDELTATVRQSADGARQVSAIVSSARTGAAHAGQVVRDAVTAMGEIEQSAVEISQIIGVIDEIAFQTNLLALNAGVEAARAGDSGRGFAVVAQEVKSLASQTARATDDITAKITAIQQATRQTVDANSSIQGTVEEVQSSADRIREAMELQAQTVTMITAAVDETALAADSMSSTIAAIRSDTENVAKDIDQVEQGFGRFSEQIAGFKSTAKEFVSGMAA